MSTTKPDTETGWSKELPPAGTYWLRSVCNPASAVVVAILGDYIKFTSGTSERFSPKLGYEFLGPISPSDFEQLRRLRKACEAAEQRLADNERWWSQEEIAIEVPESYRQAFKARAQVTRDTLDRVRAALAPVNDLRDEKPPQ